MHTLEFQLRPTPPFRLDLTAWTLARRAGNLVDVWDGETYRRVLMADGGPIALAVRQDGTPERPRLSVSATAARPALDVTRPITSALDRLLGLRIDLGPFYHLAAQDEQLGPLVARFRGAKPPRYLTLFEALVNAISCQQITLSQGIGLLSRLAVRYGALEPTTGMHAFPRPEEFARVRPSSLVRLGLSGQKAKSILELARGIENGVVNLARLNKMDNQAAVDYLRELRGVGRWTAEYVLLRGLGRLDVFPGDDVGARNNLQRWLHTAKPLDYSTVGAVVKGWQPFAGLVYFHLLLDRLAEAGALSEPPAL